MKQKKTGISLIVLVITIIVIIILATAVIVNLVKNNPIAKAREAVLKENMTYLQDGYMSYIAGRIADKKEMMVGYE